MVGVRAIRYCRKSLPRVSPSSPAHRAILPLSAHHQHQEEQRHEANALKRVRGGLSIAGRYAVFGRRLGSHVSAVTDRAHLDALSSG
jgi:hypothetical protein